MPEQRAAVTTGVDVEIKEVPEWVRYPSTNGQPMPESSFQRDTLTGIMHALKGHFPDKDVYFGSDMLIYHREGRKPESVAPDVFAVLGERFELEDVYRPSKHGGRLPDFVLEVLSKSTRDRDQTTKKDLYRKLGVKEYFLFDSEAGPADRAMWAYRLVGGEYEPMLGAGLVSGEEEYASRVLELGFRRDGEHVRVRSLATGMDYAWPEEDRTERRAEAERRERAEASLRTEAERRKSVEAGLRAEAERRESAQAENAMLLRRIAELEARLVGGASD